MLWGNTIPWDIGVLSSASAECSAWAEIWALLTYGWTSVMWEGFLLYSMLTRLIMQSETFVRIKIRAHIIWWKSEGTLGRQEGMCLSQDISWHLFGKRTQSSSSWVNLAFYFLGFHYNAQHQNILKCQNSSSDIFKMKHFNIVLKTFVSFVSSQIICQIVSTTLNFFSAINVTLISPHSLALPFKWLIHILTDT